MYHAGKRHVFSQSGFIEFTDEPDFAVMHDRSAVYEA
jgi:hypothetical protein